MGRKSLTAAIILLGILLSAELSATEKPSASMGEKLFNDPSLAGSTNARSCGTCHPGGKGLEEAGSIPDLASVINRCISGPLDGNTLDEESAEMQSLIIYIKSLKNK